MVCEICIRLPAVKLQEPAHLTPALLSIPYHQRAPLSGAIYRRARGGAVNSWVFCCVPQVPNAGPYFSDQVTGRLVERSGCVCTNLMLPPWTALNEFDAHAFKVGAIQQVGFRRAVRSRIIRTGSTGTPIMQRKKPSGSEGYTAKRSVCAPRIHASMVEYQAISAFLGKANRTLL